MKNVLKIWLVDNTVTVDNKDDKIGQLESSGNLSLKDILDEMHKEDTGLRRARREALQPCCERSHP